MRKVNIYIENQLINLFDDENIKVKSSVQDIQDIAKVFTDFSQSFTVPADKVNNDILGYYYNNDLDELNANVRLDARIEIDYVPFRKGKIQLEGTSVVDGQVESYKLTFYGDVVSLKDLFGEDKLQDLNYSSIAQGIDGASVKSAIEDSNYRDVRFPLISSERVWQYNNGSGIDLPAEAISYNELFPAVSDSKIMSLIEQKYGVNFEGSFLSDDRFKNSYTWWKNRETTNFTSEPVDLEFNVGGGQCNPVIPSGIVGDSQVHMQFIDMNSYTGTLPNFSQHYTQSHKIQIFIAPNVSGTYYLDVFENGALVTTFSGSSAQLFTVADQPNIFGLDKIYTFRLRASNAFNFNFEIKYVFEGDYFTTDPQFPTESFEENCIFQVAGVVSQAVLDFNSSAPDIKISDWFSGTLKEFNLTCYPLSDELTYQIEPLQVFYLNGDSVDITEWVDTDKIQVDRPKLYNEVSFSWQKSKSFMNEQFFEFNNRSYGDLKQIFPNHDGGKYSVKLPFETMLFNNFDDINGNLQVGYCLTKEPDFKPYIPKPVKLYYFGNLDCSFYFNDGATSSEILNYAAFGQETEQNTSKYSMNFGQELSSLTLDPINDSLYQTYYQPYLVNLFNSKTRIVTVNCILPIDILTKLTLDDAIIIRDKKYRINDMVTDLITGLVKLVLISDWIPVRRRYPTKPIISVGGAIDISIKPVKDGGYIEVLRPPILEPIFTTEPRPYPIKVTSEESLSFTVSDNTGGNTRSQTMEVNAYYQDGTLAWTDKIVIIQEGSSFFLLTEGGGNILTEDLNKIKT